MKKGSSEPFFSTVMAVHNDPGYVGQAIASVVRQTFPHWELIIVDDASDDGRTPEVIRQWAQKDPRIRVLRNKSNLMGGPSANIGIRQAKAPWITRLDSDDAYRPEYLERLAAWVRHEDNGRVFFTSWVRIIDEAGECVVNYELPGGEFIRRMAAFENFIYHSATAYPKSLWQDAGGYPNNQRPRVDYQLWKRFYERKATLEVIPEFLVDYRVHASNMTLTGMEGGRKIRLDPAMTELRQRRWRIFVFIRQARLEKAREELRAYIARAGKISLKNALYYAATYLPPRVVHFLMWNLRPVLRYLIRSVQGKNKF